MAGDRSPGAMASVLAVRGQAMAPGRQLQPQHKPCPWELPSGWPGQGCQGQLCGWLGTLLGARKACRCGRRCQGCRTGLSLGHSVLAARSKQCRKHKTLREEVGRSLELKKLGLGGTLGLPWLSPLMAGSAPLPPRLNWGPAAWADLAPDCHHHHHHQRVAGETATQCEEGVCLSPAPAARGWTQGEGSPARCGAPGSRRETHSWMAGRSFLRALLQL